MKFDWGHEDRYRSNNGKGPLVARILCATDKIVTMERWNERNKSPKPLRFRLSIKFLTSARCGWKRAAVPHGDRGSEAWLEDMEAQQALTMKALGERKCGCHACIEARGHTAMHMVVCSTCGNKRCPKATWHKFICTNSNDPGQPGSIYARS